MKHLLFALLFIPGFVHAQNTGLFIDSAGHVGVGKDTVWQPLQVFVDTGLTVEALDQQSSEMGNTSGILITPSVSDGQSFTCGKSGELMKISLRMSTENSAGSGMLEMKLRSGSAPTGPVITTKSFSIFDNVLQWYDVDLDPGTFVSDGDPFFIEISHISGDNGVWDWVDGTNPYAGGSSWQNGGSWFNITNSDLVIRTYIANAIKSNVFGVTSEAKVQINDYTLPRFDGSNGQVMTTDGVGNLTWQGVSTPSASQSIEDGDGDTKVQAEKNSDEDVIRFDVEGVEVARLDSATFHIEAPGRSLFIGKDAGIDDDGSGNENTFVGYEAGKTNTSGYFNTAIGYNTMFSNEDGDNNTAIGFRSLFHNTSGYFNSANGAYTLNKNISGTCNTANGNQALFNNTTGSVNTAIGCVSLLNNQTGSYNTANGYAALFSNIEGDSNTAVGYHALFSNTEGNTNTASGHKALWSNTMGSSNVAIGPNALATNTVRSFLVAVGDSALYKNSTGQWNTALGSQALRYNSGGSSNVAVGQQSLYSNTSGAGNTAVGSKALEENTLGSDNTAVGASAMRNSASGNNNTATGSGALFSNSGDNNTALGHRAMYTNSGDHNTAVGYQALNSNLSGYSNSSLGYRSLYNNQGGHSNTAIGYKASLFNSSGYNNVSVGDSTLHWNTSGQSNTAVGKQALYNNGLGSFNTAIGYDANTISSNFTNSMGLGYDADPNSSNTVHVGNNSITWIGGQVGWSTYSDSRFKSNINEEVVGLEFINRLRPVTYNFDLDKMQDWKAANHGEQDTSDYPEKYEIETHRFSGFIAQEVEMAANQSNYTFSGLNAPKNDKDFYSLRYAEFVVPLVKSVQELSKENEDLRNQNTDLLDLIRSLERRVSNLEGQ